MSVPRSPPRRDPKLRLALHLECYYAGVAARPDSPQQSAERVLFQCEFVRQLVRRRQTCQARRWPTADRVLAGRLSAELRTLRHVLESLDRTVPPPRPPVTMASIHRDLQALDAEFDGLEIADDVSSVSVITDAITLEGVGLGRFRLTLDLAALARGRTGGDCLNAEALDPNPAACNDEITHPHVQAGTVCLGDGSHLLKAALAEGRLYDAFTVVDRVLHTYNDASPYVSLTKWHGRTCDDCDDVVGEDETYGCEACGNVLCPSCEYRCPDCDYSYCRSCLTAKDGELLCTSCYDERVAREEEEAEQDDEDECNEPDGALPSGDPHPFAPEETPHAQATTPAAQPG